MNLNSLYSIINLYVKREKNNKAIMTIEKQDEQIEFNLSMQKNSQDKTIITLPLEIVIEAKKHLLDLFRQDKIVIDEKYVDNIYTLVFNNGRELSLKGFSLIEINEWRNDLFDIKIRKEEMRLPVESKPMNLPMKPRLQVTGFTSMISLFLTVLVLSGVLITSLWICKMFL